MRTRIQENSYYEYELNHFNEKAIVVEFINKINTLIVFC